MLLTPEQKEVLQKEIRKAWAYADFRSQQSAMEYLEHLIIDSRPDPRPFRELGDPWQWTLNRKVARAIESLTRVNCDPYDGPRRFWFVLPRGHDKTSASGRLMNWALAYSKVPLRAVAGAADKEQANFLKEFAQTEAKLNPWLNRRLKFTTNMVQGTFTGSQLRILSADEYSSYGLKEDLIFLDEITHWEKPGLWKSIITGLPKRKNAVLIVISNAGLLRTWQYEAFLEAKRSKNWFVYQSPGVIASWLDQETLAEARRMVPPAVARRLFDNIWIDPAHECQFLSREQCLACLDPLLSERQRGISDKGPYLASIDYAPFHDRTVLGVAHVEQDELGRLHVVIDRMDVMQGNRSENRRVPIADVEDWIERQMERFPGLWLVADPYQLEATIQRYELKLPVERFEARGGKSNYELASNLRSLVLQQRLHWYSGCGAVIHPSTGNLHELTDELSEVVIRPMSYGFRIDHERTEHDDRAVVAGMLALTLVRQGSQIDLGSDPLLERYF
jgi:hypothetical protein